MIMDHGGNRNEERNGLRMRYALAEQAVHNHSAALRRMGLRLDRLEEQVTRNDAALTMLSQRMQTNSMALDRNSAAYDRLSDAVMALNQKLDRLDDRVDRHTTSVPRLALLAWGSFAGFLLSTGVAIATAINPQVADAIRWLLAIKGD